MNRKQLSIMYIGGGGYSLVEFVQNAHITGMEAPPD